MKTFDEINVEEALNEEDFATLLNASALNASEKKNVPIFFKLYCQFLEAGTQPMQSWIAIKNIILLKRAQDEFINNKVELRTENISKCILTEEGIQYNGPIVHIAPITTGS